MVACDHLQGLNGQELKSARFRGEFVWHLHEHEDEAFMVIEGFDMPFKFPQVVHLEKVGSSWYLKEQNMSGGRTGCWKFF